MDQDFYIQLIHQSLRDELSAEGAERLAAWRGASQENADLEAQVRKGWELSGQYDPELSLDVPAAYNKLRTRVRAHEKKSVAPQTASVRPLRRWLSIAASLLVLMTAVWIFWPGTEPKTPLVVVELGPDEPARKIALPDGSNGWLQPNSRLRYPEVFADNERQIELSGEAYFQVEKKPAAPFRVKTDALTVEVLGTEFLVRAYPTNDIEVSVDEGRVAVFTTKERMVLIAGKVARYQREDQSLRPAIFDPNAKAWQSNALTFIDQPLSAVIADLEQYAGITVTLENSALNECLFSGRTSGNSPQTTTTKLLNTLAETFGLEWTYDGNNYQISGGNCQ